MRPPCLSPVADTVANVMPDRTRALRTAWRVCDHVAIVRDDDHVAVLSMSSVEPRPYALATSAVAIWEAIDGSRTTDEIATVVAERFGIGTADILDQVAMFLSDLHERTILEQVDQT